MKKYSNNIKERLGSTILSQYYCLLNFLLLPHLAVAQLPTPVDPSGGDAGGNFILFMQRWSAVAVDYMALVISAAGFLWIGWILLSKFNEARTSKDPDRGSVGLTAVIAGVLLVIVTYFLTQATGIIGGAAPGP
jgi:integrating conjugative element membrane protein (TIGR03745 family)